MKYYNYLILFNILFNIFIIAIAAYHVPLCGLSLERNPLITHFFRGILRLRPATRTRVLAQDLAILLEGLSAAPFEPSEILRYFKNSISPSHFFFKRPFWRPLPALSLHQGWLKHFFILSRAVSPRFRGPLCCKPSTLPAAGWSSPLTFVRFYVQILSKGSCITLPYFIDPGLLFLFYI